jgi:hypothetical protein
MVALSLLLIGWSTDSHLSAHLERYPGFNSHNVLSLRLSLPSVTYPKPESIVPSFAE